MKRTEVCLRHVLTCMETIEEYRGRDRAQFLANSMAKDAVLRQLQVMAESTLRIPDSLKSRHPEVDWRALSAFRNVLVHNYLGIDVEQAVVAVDRNGPALAAAVRAMLRELDAE